MLVKPSYFGSAYGKKVLFFGESPGKEEAKDGHAFVGRSGRLLRDCVAASLPGVQCKADNVCPEVLDEGKKPVPRTLEKYAHYVCNSIEEFKPHVIVALGEYALKGLGIKVKPLRACGKVFSWGKTKVVGCVHPSYVLRSGGRELKRIREALCVTRSELGGKTSSQVDYDLIESPRQAETYLRSLKKKLVAVDIETTMLNPHADGAKILCVGVADNERVVVFPTRESSSEPLLEKITRWWSTGPRICHNAHFELSWFSRFGAGRPTAIHDTLLQAWMVDENQPRGLDALLSRMGIRSYWSDIDLKHPEQNDPRALHDYNACDAKYTYDLRTWQEEKLSPGQIRLLEECIYPLQFLLMDMEERGIRVDRNYLIECLKEEASNSKRLEKQVRKLWPELNPRSTKQVEKLVYEELRLPVIARTKKGNRPSVDEKTLIALAKDNEAVRPLAEWRKSLGLQSRLYTPWLKISEKDDTLRTHYVLAGTVTGRLASQRPNLQNVDKKGKAKAAFQSRYPRGCLINADFDQHELRIMATVVGEKKLLKVLKSGTDVHQFVADEMKIDRHQAKTCNFSLIYGISVYGLVQKNGWTEETATRLRSGWFEKYPKFPEFHKATRQQVLNEGFVTTPFGWVRHLRDPSNDKRFRQAYNHPGQSTAVVICYLAMLELEQARIEGKIKSLVIHHVHDSIVLDCPDRKIAGSECKKIREIMVNVRYKHLLLPEFSRMSFPLAAKVEIVEQRKENTNGKISKIRKRKS